VRGRAPFTVEFLAIVMCYVKRPTGTRVAIALKAFGPGLDPASTLHGTPGNCTSTDA